MLNFILSFYLVFFSPSFYLSITWSGSFSQSSGDSETRTTFRNIASHGRSNSFSLHRWCDCQINQTAERLGQLPGKTVHFHVLLSFGFVVLEPAKHSSRRDISMLVLDTLICHFRCV